MTFAHDIPGPYPEQAREAVARVDADVLLAHVVAAARHAGDFLREAATSRGTLDWREKAGTDFVTEADLGSERRLRQRLVERPTPGMPPGTRVTMRAEEGSPDEALHDGLLYVVDPLDGTTNFLHGFPWYAVSVAALLDGVAVLGVVLNVATGELFTAIRDRGAWRDGAPIAVSTIADPARALLGTGFPFLDPAHVAPYLAALPNILTETSGIRRAGAAALDLCDVACGRFEAFWELRLAPWDFAAAALVAREAGAIVTDLAGRPLALRHTAVLAGNAPLHAWLLDRLRPSRDGAA